MTTVNYRLEPHPQYGFRQVTPTPSAEEITRYYADEFYSSNYPRLNNSALDVQVVDKDFHDAHREDLCSKIAELSGRPLAGQTILDIGCGWGQFLLYFREKGGICYGFDPAPEAVAYARAQGLNVVQAGMESIDVFNGLKFDVVTLLNVLEHLADPVAVVAEIRDRILKPGGILLIEVPNDFNAFQEAGKAIHGLNEWWVAPPAHLNYFNNESLQRLLRGASYEVKHAEATFPMELFLLFGENYVADPNLGRSCHERRMAFEMNLRNHDQGDALHRFYQALAEQNLGRQIVVYATPAP